MQKIVVSKNEAGQKLLKLLSKYLNAAPQGFLHKMLRKKNITLNGKKADGSELLCDADEVCLFLSDETIAGFRSDGMSFGGNRMNPAEAGQRNRLPSLTELQKKEKGLAQLQVIYEDGDVLVLNKPAGVLSQKAEAEDVSVNEWVIAYLLDSGALTERELQTFRPGVCNRLDRNTSGLILAGKSLAGLQQLSALLKERTVHKDYFCIVRGRVERASHLKGYLTKNEKSNQVTVTQTNKSGAASYIETEYTPLALSGEYTLLKVRLITGKTHQIRAHLASVGHPILGDRKYEGQKGKTSGTERFGLKNQLLHAAYLTFPEETERCPELSGKQMFAPVPKQFAKIAAEAGVYTVELEQGSRN